MKISQKSGSDRRRVFRSVWGAVALLIMIALLPGLSACGSQDRSDRGNVDTGSGLDTDAAAVARIAARRPLATYGAISSDGAAASFLVFGDVQPEGGLGDYDVVGEIFQMAVREHPDVDFSLQCGDITNTGGAPEEWEAFFKAAQGKFSESPLLTTPGNHEFSPYARDKGRKPEAYLAAFDLPENGPEGYKELYYSFDCGNVHVVSLTANYLDPTEGYSDDMKENEKIAARVDGWIRDDLAAADGKWKIVFMHQPAFPLEGDSTTTGMRERWLPIFYEAGVDLILCGHQHEMMRTFPIADDGGAAVDQSGGGITEVMVNTSVKTYGGGRNSDAIAAFEYAGSGYAYVSASADKLTVYTYDSGGRRIDSYEEDRMADG